VTQSSATFFCYAREDSDFALRLAKELRDRGIEIWIDQLDIPAGAPWDREIEKAIEASGRLLVVLSPHSVASENVMDEVSFALDQGDRVVPVLLEACDVPLRIRRLQYVDFTVDHDKGLARLLSALSAAGDDAETPEPPAVSSSPAEVAPAPDQPAPGRVVPSKRKRIGLIVGIAAVVALLAIIGLTRKPRQPGNRRQTSSAGSGVVVVPGVVGVMQDSALAALARQKLEGSVVGTMETCSKPVGAVVRQSPAGMTQAKAGSQVKLVIAERTQIPLPEGPNEMTVLAPGAGEAGPGRERRPTRVEFMLAGDPCAVGRVIVAHPKAGREVYELKAGERGSRNIVFGPGKITVQFESLDRGARLVTRID